MGISRFTIKNIRVIESAEFEFSPQLNIILGPNGSGKTSILEAIHLLGTARSFRSSSLQDVLKHQADTFQVTGKITARQGQSIGLGFEKNKPGLRMKAGAQPLKRVSELASWLPQQIIHPDSHLLISGGPKQRRRFLDWGVFHVEPKFLPVWRRYDKALKQRNASLKYRERPKLEQVWDQELSASAQIVHQQRKAYVDQLSEVLPKFSRAIVDVEDCSIDYQPGWDVGRPLDEILVEQLDKDRQRGFTCSGPHRAELIFRVNDKPAQQFVSRGQQKMLVCALFLAQTQLLMQETGNKAIVLLDDLTAELDNTHQSRLLEVLQAMRVQVFITAVNVKGIELQGWEGFKMFHVEHGNVSEMVQ